MGSSKISDFWGERRHQEPVYLAEWYKPMRLIAEREDAFFY